MRIIIFITIMIIALSAPLWGFGPYDHYKLSPYTYEGYSNLPDIWKSRDEDWWCNSLTIGGGAEPSTYFGWSHDCLRNGVTYCQGTITIYYNSTPIYDVDFSGYYPNTPTKYGNPSGIEDNANDMYYIWKNKLLAENKTSIMRKTAIGFKIHNTEDYFVHFSFFLAGTPEFWIVDHMLKENWSEFIMYLHNGGDWDELGMPTIVQGMYCQGDAGIINLGQKVFRKNRQTVDASVALSGSYETIAVETATEISGKIQSKNTEIDKYFDREYWGLYSKFDLTRFILYNQIAEAEGWNDEDLSWLINHYDDIQDAAGAIPDAMP
jgi:hypothetical protein